MIDLLEKRLISHSKFHCNYTGWLSFVAFSQPPHPSYYFRKKNVRFLSVFLRPDESEDKLTLKKIAKIYVVPISGLQKLPKTSGCVLSKSFSKPKNLEVFFLVFFSRATLPKTNSSPLKIGHSQKERIVFQPSIFRCVCC